MKLRRPFFQITKEREKNLEELAKVESQLKLSYESKLKQLEDEKQFMRDVSRFQDSKVKLDVGGIIFSTSISTLCKFENSMLAAMFSGRHQLVLSEDGSYFIDRDGTYFRYILNFLRGRITEPNDLPSDRQILREIRQESDFYQLVELSAVIDEIMSSEELGLNDYSQEEINKILSTVVRTEKVSKSPLSNSRLFNHGISVASAALRHQSSTDSSSPSKAAFVVQNMTKNKLDFTGKNLTGISFSHTTFNHDVSFRNANLSGAVFYGCEFNIGCTIDFTHADLRDCDFRNCKGKEAGPKMSFGPSTFEFGNGGLVSGASSDIFVRLIQEKKIVFRGVKIEGAKFDPNVFAAIKNCAT